MYCVLHSYLYRCGIRASLYLYSCYFTFEAYLQTNKSAGVAHWSETTKRVNSWNKGDTAYSQWHYFHLRFLSISDKWRKTILPSKAQHIVGLFSAILEFVYKQIPETQKGASRVCEALGCGCSSLKSFLFLNWSEGASWMCVCGWSTRPKSKLLNECKKSEKKTVANESDQWPETDKKWQTLAAEFDLCHCIIAVHCLNQADLVKIKKQIPKRENSCLL